MGHATVAFTLDTYSHVVPGLQEAGVYSFDIDLASGIYLINVTAGKNGKSSKLLMLK